MHFSVTQPVYLYRNLTYMQYRSTRTNKDRSTFKVNSLLERVEKSIPSRLGDYMTLMFLGYFDKSINDMDVVEVETFLSKTTFRKRKDIRPSLDQVSQILKKVNLLSFHELLLYRWDHRWSKLIQMMVY